MMGILTALVMAAAQTASPSAATACPAVKEQEIRARFNKFVDTLLIERQPRKAFQTYAQQDLIQHNSMFGTNRETTIAQWEKMTNSPDAKFWISGVSIENDLGTLRFRGLLAPGTPGANVTIFFRFHCGSIAETWDILSVDSK
jgi:predicted SnoaL-like aldol condensation-catalyzing enzyme